MNGGGVVAALVAHHQGGLAGEGREFNLAVDAVGDVPRQRGLAGSGIAEQPEYRRRAVLAGFCFQPVGDGLQRGILMRRKGRHGISVEGGAGSEGGRDSIEAKLTIRAVNTSCLPRCGIGRTLDSAFTGNTLPQTTARTATSISANRSNYSRGK